MTTAVAVQSVPAEATDWSYKPYAGIGSRESPEHILWVMRELATRMALDGWTLRSGGAAGADTAFEQGAKAAQPGMPPGMTVPREIYTVADVAKLKAQKTSAQAYQSYVQLYEMARSAHPNWAATAPKAGDDYTRHLLMRNAMQILGPAPITAPVPAIVVIYYSKGTGGTEQAIRYAEKWNAGVYGAKPEEAIDLRNLFDPAILRRALAYLETDETDYRARWNLGRDLQPRSAPPRPAAPSWPARTAAETVAPAKGSHVWTILANDEALGALCGRLRKSGITTVVDARPEAVQRRAKPWLQQADLESHLTLQGFTYVHSPRLAAGLLDEVLPTLIGHVTGHPEERVALLCEPDSAIAKAVRAKGLSVRHITPAGDDVAA